jgi:hypothetical protein
MRGFISSIALEGKFGADAEASSISPSNGKSKPVNQGKPADVHHTFLIPACARPSIRDNAQP